MIFGPCILFSVIPNDVQNVLASYCVHCADTEKDGHSGQRDLITRVLASVYHIYMWTAGETGGHVGGRIIIILLLLLLLNLFACNT